jgi:D-glycerate 3-kinase
MQRGEGLLRSLEEGEIDAFIQHYQRLTEHILREMPARADVVFHLDAQRNVLPAPP